MTALQSTVNYQKEEIQKLEDEKSQILQDLQNMGENVLKQATQENKELQQQNQQFIKENNQLKQENQQFQQQNEILIEKNKNLEIEMNKFKELYENLRSEEEQLSKKMKEKEFEKEKENWIHEQKCQQIGSTSEKLQEKIDNLSKQLEIANENIQNLGVENNENSQILQNLKNENFEVKSENEVLLKKISDLEENNKLLNLNCQQNKELNSQQEEQIQTQEQLFSEQKLKYQEQILGLEEQLNKQITELESVNRELKKKEKNFHKDKKKLEEENIKYKQKHEDLLKQIKENSLKNKKNYQKALSHTFLSENQENYNINFNTQEDQDTPIHSQQMKFNSSDPFQQINSQFKDNIIDYNQQQSVNTTPFQKQNFGNGRGVRNVQFFEGNYNSGNSPDLQREYVKQIIEQEHEIEKFNIEYDVLLQKTKNENEPSKRAALRKELMSMVETIKRHQELLHKSRVNEKLNSGLQNSKQFSSQQNNQKYNIGSTPNLTNKFSSSKINNSQYTFNNNSSSNK